MYFGMSRHAFHLAMASSAASVLVVFAWDLGVEAYAQYRDEQD